MTGTEHHTARLERRVQFMTDDGTSTHPAARFAYERFCVHEGCGKWGCFGLERGRGVSGYWCQEHLPADYWDGRTGDASAR